MGRIFEFSWNVPSWLHHWANPTWPGCDPHHGCHQPGLEGEKLTRNRVRSRYKDFTKSHRNQCFCGVLWSCMEICVARCGVLWRCEVLWWTTFPILETLRNNGHIHFWSNRWMFDIYHSNSVKILLIHLYSLRIKLPVWPVSKDSRLKRLKYLGKGQNEDPNFCEISDLSWPIYSYKKPKQITAVVTERQQWRRRRRRRRQERRQRQLRHHHRQTIILIKPWSSSATASSSSSHLTNQQSQISRTSARWWPGWEALNGVAVIRWPTLLRRPAPTSVPNP